MSLFLLTIFPPLERLILQVENSNVREVWGWGRERKFNLTHSPIIVNNLAVSLLLLATKKEQFVPLQLSGAKKRLREVKISPPPAKKSDQNN